MNSCYILLYNVLALQNKTHFVKDFLVKHHKMIVKVFKNATIIFITSILLSSQKQNLIYSNVLKAINRKDAYRLIFLY